MTMHIQSARFQGLTWDHPRGYGALAAAAKQVQPLIHWSAQPLEGFESRPVAELARRFDLIVLDHPHIGEAVAEDCLIPLEDLYPPEQIQSWGRETIGQSLASYKFAGRHWALPLDFATQVMARRPDMIANPPESFAELDALAQRGGVALSLAGPHAVLTLMSLAAASGDRPLGEEFISDEPALASLARLHRLYARRPKRSELLNPIELLEAMARRDEIRLIPLIFGYVTYARLGAARKAIAFSDCLRSSDGFAGVLGGTGIGFSKRAQPSIDLLAHIAWLMRPSTQNGFIPSHGGQPALRQAWQDAAVNEAWGGFYGSTMNSAENALLRPRFDGYIDFQTRASARLRNALEAGEAEAKTLAALRTLWRDARAKARGDLDDERH